MNLDYLRRPEFAPLWSAARRTWERNGGLRGEVRLGPLTEAEATELDGLLSWLRKRPREGGAVSIPLAKLDERLRTGGLAPSLRDALEALGGPLRDLPAERSAAASSWEKLWRDAAEHPAAHSPRAPLWLQQLRASGGLKRAARGEEQRALRGCLDVLASLPRDGVELSRVASEVLGDAHALDYGTAVGGLTAAAVAFLGDRARPSSAAAWREVWATVGVLCDALSCNVLVLGLRPIGPSAVSCALRLLSEAGEPAVLTLRQLSREKLSFEPETVFICENPAVVSAAAETLGADTRPLVCGGGWPNTAVGSLLGSLRASRCELRYQGDFDEEGVQIAAHFRNAHGATEWRFDSATYGAALARRTRGRVRCESGDDIASTIRSTGIAVYEEDIVEALAQDLRRQNDVPVVSLDGGVPAAP